MIFWPVTITDVVHADLGASMGFIQSLRAYMAAAGCLLVVSEAFSIDWTKARWASFWDIQMVDSLFQARWRLASDCGIGWARNFGPHALRCDMPPGYLSDAKLDAFLRTPQYNGQLFNGWYELWLQTFGPRLISYRQPYNHTYVGIHVRQRYEVAELYSVVKHFWPQTSDLFIATDDKSIFQEAVQQANETELNVPLAADFGTTTASFDKIAGLATSTFLVGDTNSNDFNVMRALNAVLHHGKFRPHPWCYDNFRKTVCDCWPSTVLQC